MPRSNLSPGRSIAPVRPVLLMGIATILGCSAGLRNSSASIVPDDVIGRWRNHENGFVVEVERRHEQYAMIGIADHVRMLPEPEVIGEFRVDRDASLQFVGRHSWGGRWGTSGESERWWGDDGGLKVLQLTKDSIFVQFTDSRYTGGWTYVREPRR